MATSGYSEWMLAILAGGALVACWSDYRRHRVSNSLCGALLAAGLAAQCLFHGGHGLQQGLLGMLVGGGPLLALWLGRFMGAGDVKFMAAVGAWLGPSLALEGLVVGGLAGGVMAGAMICLRGGVQQSATNVAVFLSRVTAARSCLSGVGNLGFTGGQQTFVPYAIPLSVGALSVAFGHYFGWWGIL